MRYFSLALLICLAAAPLRAQQDAGTHIGVGIRVNDLLSDLATATFSDGDLLGLGAVLLVPIDVRGTFRVEPEVGFGRVSNSSEDGDFETTSSRYHLGLGLMKLLPRDAFGLYVGGRVQYTRSVETDNFPSDDDELVRTISGLGPVVGGDYRFAPRFSLGGEAGLLYRSFGFESNGEEIETNLSSLSTTGAVYVRFYFN